MLTKDRKAVVRLFEPADWPDVAGIYREGLLSRNATFETEVPSYEVWDQKYRRDLRWVAVVGDRIAGWAGLLPVSQRKVYEGVMEVSVYVAGDFQGLGIGRQLMQHLIGESERAGVWTLYSSIFPENEASVRLHMQSGFRKIGYREKIARLDGQWRDTVLFERRSRVNI